MRWFVLFFLWLLISGCTDLSDAGNAKFAVQVPMPEHYRFAEAPRKLVRGDTEVAGAVYILQASVSDMVEIYDKELVEKQGWTKKKHGRRGFLYRAKDREIMIRRVKKGPDGRGGTDTELRVGHLLKGEMPETPITVGF